MKKVVPERGEIRSVESLKEKTGQEGTKGGAVSGGGKWKRGGLVQLHKPHTLGAGPVLVNYWRLRKKNKSREERAA